MQSAFSFDNMKFLFFSGYKRKYLYEFNTLQDITEFYIQALYYTGRRGIYKECYNCTLRINDKCLGGCIVHDYLKSEKRFHHFK